ncbi:hypothetical protein SLS54_004658 [Diplodia seriata]
MDSEHPVPGQRYTHSDKWMAEDDMEDEADESIRDHTDDVYSDEPDYTLPRSSQHNGHERQHMSNGGSYYMRGHGHHPSARGNYLPEPDYPSRNGYRSSPERRRNASPNERHRDHLARSSQKIDARKFKTFDDFSNQAASQRTQPLNGQLNPQLEVIDLCSDEDDDDDYQRPSAASRHARHGCNPPASKRRPSDLERSRRRERDNVIIADNIGPDYAIADAEYHRPRERSRSRKRLKINDRSLAAAQGTYYTGVEDFNGRHRDAVVSKRPRSPEEVYYPSRPPTIQQAPKRQHGSDHWPEKRRSGMPPEGAIGQYVYHRRPPVVQAFMDEDSDEEEAWPLPDNKAPKKLSKAREDGSRDGQVQKGSILKKTTTSDLTAPERQTGRPPTVQHHYDKLSGISASQALRERARRERHENGVNSLFGDDDDDDDPPAAAAAAAANGYHHHQHHQHHQPPSTTTAFGATKSTTTGHPAPPLHPPPSPSPSSKFPPQQPAINKSLTSTRQLMQETARRIRESNTQEEYSKASSGASSSPFGTPTPRLGGGRLGGPPPRLLSKKVPASFSSSSSLSSVVKRKSGGGVVDVSSAEETSSSESDGGGGRAGRRRGHGEQHGEKTAAASSPSLLPLPPPPPPPPTAASVAAASAKSSQATTHPLPAARRERTSNAAMIKKLLKQQGRAKKVEEPAAVTTSQKKPTAAAEASKESEAKEEKAAWQQALAALDAGVGGKKNTRDDGNGNGYTSSFSSALRRSSPLPPPPPPPPPRARENHAIDSVEKSRDDDVDAKSSSSSSDASEFEREDVMASVLEDARREKEKQKKLKEEGLRQKRLAYHERRAQQEREKGEIMADGGGKERVEKKKSAAKEGKQTKNKKKKTAVGERKVKSDEFVEEDDEDGGEDEAMIYANGLEEDDQELGFADELAEDGDQVDADMPEGDGELDDMDDLFNEPSDVATGQAVTCQENSDEAGHLETVGSMKGKEFDLPDEDLSDVISSLSSPARTSAPLDFLLPDTHIATNKNAGANNTQQTPSTNTAVSNQAAEPTQETTGDSSPSAASTAATSQDVATNDTLQKKSAHEAEKSNPEEPTSLQSMLAGATKEQAKDRNDDRSGARKPAPSGNAREAAQRNAARREQALANGPLKKHMQQPSSGNKLGGTGAGSTRPVGRPPKSSSSSAFMPAAKPKNLHAGAIKNNNNLLPRESDLLPAKATKKRTNNTTTTTTTTRRPALRPPPTTTAPPHDPDDFGPLVDPNKTPTTPLSVLEEHDDKQLHHWREKGLAWAEIRILYAARTGKRFSAQGLRDRLKRVRRRWPELVATKDGDGGKKGGDDAGLIGLPAAVAAREREEREREEEKEEEQQQPRLGGKKWDPNAYERYMANQQAMADFLTDGEGESGDDGDESTTTSDDDDGNNNKTKQALTKTKTRTVTAIEPEPLDENEVWFQYHVTRKCWSTTTTSSSSSSEEEEAAEAEAAAAAEAEAPTYAIGPAAHTTLRAANAAAGDEIQRSRFGVAGIAPGCKSFSCEADNEGMLHYRVEHVEQQQQQPVLGGTRKGKRVTTTTTTVVRVDVGRSLRAPGEGAGRVGGGDDVVGGGVGWLAKRQWVVCVEEVGTRTVEVVGREGGDGGGESEGEDNMESEHDGGDDGGSNHDDDGNSDEGNNDNVDHNIVDDVANDTTATATATVTTTAAAAAAALPTDPDFDDLFKNIDDLFLEPSSPQPNPEYPQQTTETNTNDHQPSTSSSPSPSPSPAAAAPPPPPPAEEAVTAAAPSRSPHHHHHKQPIITHHTTRILGAYTVRDAANRDAAAALLDACMPRRPHIDAIEAREAMRKELEARVDELEAEEGLFECSVEVPPGTTTTGGGSEVQAEGEGAEVVEVRVWVEEVGLGGPRNVV